MKFTAEQIQQLQLAGTLSRQAAELRDRIDRIVEPIALELIRQVELAPDTGRLDLERALEQLPEGFHRSEARFAIYRKYGR